MAVIGAFLTFHAWLHFTNPFAAINIVDQPYTTYMENGEIKVKKHFDLEVLGGPIAESLGYYKGGFLIAQNNLFGGDPARAATPPSILDEIYRQRFDREKPYLISGDQFSVFYPRDISIFYNAMINPFTAHDQADWENRQRLYLQTALYATDVFAKAGKITTTVVPIGPKSVLLTQVHPGSKPSDTLHGILYAFWTLQDEQKFQDAPYKLQTVKVTRLLTRAREADLKKLLKIYLNDVRDPATGLVKRGVVLSGARDGIHRESSFYDNLILWHTLTLADRLGVSQAAPDELENMRQKIIGLYWDEAEGHFKDDLKNRAARSNYSSDWLVALPVGFLNPADPNDRRYLESSVTFMRAEKVAEPLPIKYTVKAEPESAPWIVRTFVPNYGGNAIWSYWGAEYLTLLANLYHQTQKPSYRDEAERGIAKYLEKIEKYGGFPETFTPEGEFLSSIAYKSILRTGWAVQLEAAMQILEPEQFASQFIPAAHQNIAGAQTTTCNFWICDISK